MPNPTTLTDDQISERTLILSEVDAVTCEGCETPVPTEAAAAPDWFIDSMLVPNESCPAAPVTVAVIRCPRCW